MKTSKQMGATESCLAGVCNGSSEGKVAAWGSFCGVGFVHPVCSVDDTHPCIFNKS